MNQSYRSQTNIPSQRSPYGLIQEDMKDDPWKLLVCCIMLNLTSRKQAEPVWNKFFERWNSAEELFLSDVERVDDVIKEISEMLKPIGLQNRRAKSIWRMTLDFLTLRPDKDDDVDPTNMSGIGKYASDSFNMFFRRRLVDDVKDKELRRYVSWVKSTFTNVDDVLKSSHEQLSS